MVKKQIFLVVGLAGSGKTTFCQRLYSWLSSKNLQIDPKSGLNKFIFSANLDPAVVNPRMPLNYDIRDHIDYDLLMEKHNIGPNGAILTALNMFCLQIDKFIEELDKEYVIIDTPGQIEAFSWSSSGQIIVDMLKSFKDHTVTLLYLVDSSHASESPSVFMSSMMYAASVKCRFDIPLLCLFTKVDIGDSERLKKWITDYEAFTQELKGDEILCSTLNSMALYFEEIYNNIDTLAISAALGLGKKEFFKYFTIE